MDRLKQALKVGFQHLIFEDNYDTGTGDHYSLRQMCDQFYIRGQYVCFFSCTWVMHSCIQVLISCSVAHWLLIDCYRKFRLAFTPVFCFDMSYIMSAHFVMPDY